MTELPHFSFYGLKVSSFSYNELVDYIKEVISENRNITCYGYSLGIIPYIKKFPVIYELGENSELLVTDGRLFYLLLKAMDFPVSYEISIPGLTNLLLKIANQEKYSVLLFGGSIDSNRRASENIKKEYAEINVIEGINGFYNQDEESDIVQRINIKKPNILLIGMSSPKKDEFLVKYKKNLESSISVPCGGMIEVYAGYINETPKFIKKLGMASAYRLSQEPRRLLKRYSFIYSFLFFRFIPVFIVKVMVFKVKNFSIPRFCDIIQ